MHHIHLSALNLELTRVAGGRGWGLGGWGGGGCKYHCCSWDKLTTDVNNPCVCQLFLLR